MDSISPLAKILAEANGIDWQSIQGSGSGGSVVEQDILSYLSRIMSGEEEPPATPVDEAPLGWTGEMPPMPVAASGLEALSAAGVDTDITDFVAQQSQAAQSLPVQPVLPEVASPEPALPAASAPAVSAETSAPVDLEFELDDLDDNLAADDLVADDLAVHAAPPHHADLPGLQDAPAQTEPRPEFGSVAVYGAAALEAADLGRAGMGMTGLGEPVQHESARFEQAQPEPVQFQQPAYDPVALDADADFVLADRLPGLPTALMEPVTPQEPVILPEPVLAEQFVVAEHPVQAEQAVAESLPENVAPLENQAPPESVLPAEISGAGSVAVGAVAGGAVAFGLGGFLSRLYGTKAKTEAAPEVRPPEALRAEPPAAQAVPAGSDEPTPHETGVGEALISQAPSIPGAPVMAPLVADQWRDQELTGPALPALGLNELGLQGSPHTALGQPTDLPEAHEAEDQAGSAPVFSEQVFDEQVSAEEVAAEPRPAPELPTPEVLIPEQALPVQGTPSWTDVVEPLGAGAAVGLGVHGNAGQHREQGADMQQEVPAPAHGETPERSTSEQTVPPASHTAITLRLNLDLHLLETARTQLSAALVRDVPLGLLVARAAARSLGTLGLGTLGLGTLGLGTLGLGTFGLHAPGSVQQGVALANHAGQPLAADLGAEFRASLDGLGHVTETQPALLVLDASALGLDELHRGECSLCLGRASTDGVHSLSLRGDLDPGRGAQFLHEVAGLLGTPILLLF